jgi:ribosome-associated translation inhibitor RaiA
LEEAHRATSFAADAPSICFDVSRGGCPSGPKKDKKMQILISSDKHVQVSSKLNRLVETVVTRTSDRFGRRITRVEVHLSDQDSSQKSGDNDKRCVMEARLAGLQPIAVSHQSSSMEQAIIVASNKLANILTRTLGRRHVPQRRAFVRMRGRPELAR